MFRFNRRASRRRGLLFLRALEMTVAHEPVRYRDLVLSEGTTRTVPKPGDQAAIRPVWND